MTWHPICPYPRLEPERGVAALVAGHAVAVFRLYDGSLAAIANLDPLTRAPVLARGIVGTRGEVPTLTSPLHKQVYDLRTGACLDTPDAGVRAYPVRVRDGIVEVRVAE